LIGVTVLEMDDGVLLQPDGKDDVVFQQEFHPPDADELAIGE
jgi:hypothetical protein